MIKPNPQDLVCPPGTAQFRWLEVTTRLDGTVLRLPVHVLTGAQPGPTLTLTACLHGSEWLPIEVLRRLRASLDPQTMRGRVMMVPVANPEAFKNLTRNTRDESDEPDLNRVFPGGNTWQTVQIAAVLTEGVLKQTNYLVDFHMGIWGSAMGEVGYGQDFPDPQVRDKAAAMARAYGYPLIRRLQSIGAFPGPRSITAFSAAQLGIPAIGASIGGAGFAPELEEKWIELNLTGLRNVMMHLGILEGKPDLPKRYLVMSGRGHRVVPSVGGYFHPVVPPEALLKEVSKGEVLGRVVSPYTFEEIEVLRSPVRGVLFGTARPYPVWPGDWAYFVADLDDPGTQWVDA